MLNNRSQDLPQVIHNPKQEKYLKHLHRSVKKRLSQKLQINLQIQQYIMNNKKRPPIIIGGLFQYFSERIKNTIS